MVSVADVTSRARPRTREVRVCLDGDLLGEIDAAVDAVRNALRADKLAGEGLASEAPIMARQLEELNARAAEAVTVFSMRAIPGEDFDELKRRFPPTEEQWLRFREVAKASPMFAEPPELNFAEFIPRLLGLSITAIDGEPATWTEEDGVELWATLHDGARADLGGAAFDVNSRSSIRPTYGTGTEETPTSGPASTTSLNGESLSLSSSEES